MGIGFGNTEGGGAMIGGAQVDCQLADLLADRDELITSLRQAVSDAADLLAQAQAERDAVKIASVRAAADHRAEVDRLKTALRRADEKAARFEREALMLERVWLAHRSGGDVAAAFAGWQPGRVAK